MRELITFGRPGEATVQQMENCMKIGNVARGVLCGDAHLGYAQPVGGVVAYEGMVSISGVGFDIGCGCYGIKTNLNYGEVAKRDFSDILNLITRKISFGIGRNNQERVEHPLFDDPAAWRKADVLELRKKAENQLGTVGSGNHYIDLLYEVDEVPSGGNNAAVNEGGPARDRAPVWIGIHFGSRGLGHNTATKYLRAAGGKDGMLVDPTVLKVNSELAQRYLAAMELAGRYAYAGREWVGGKVLEILGAEAIDSVHNHHNFAWVEKHDGRELFVVRKGATPAFPGQRGFVGGSMGDDAVIVEGIDSAKSRKSLYSTVHGAGRVLGRKRAKQTLKREDMDRWLQEREVTLSGADLDEAPMAYRRLHEVLNEHEGTIKINHRLRPFAVAMASKHVQDPFRD